MIRSPGECTKSINHILIDAVAQAHIPTEILIWLYAASTDFLFSIEKEWQRGTSYLQSTREEKKNEQEKNFNQKPNFTRFLCVCVCFNFGPELISIKNVVLRQTYDLIFIKIKNLRANFSCIQNCIAFSYLRCCYDAI